MISCFSDWSQFRVPAAVRSFLLLVVFKETF